MNYFKLYTAYDKGIDRTVGMAVSESALLPPKYSFSTLLICFFSFSLSFLVLSSYFFWLRSASFWAFSFLDSTFFLKKKPYSCKTNNRGLLYSFLCVKSFYLFCIICDAAALSKYWSTCDLPCMAANCIAVRKSKSKAHKLTSKPTRKVTQLKCPLDAARCNAFCPRW